MSTTEANPQDEFDAAFAEATGGKPAPDTPPPSGSDAPQAVAQEVPKDSQAEPQEPKAAPVDDPSGQSQPPAETADPLKELEEQIRLANYRERQSAGRASQTAKLNAQLQQQLEEQRRKVKELEAAQAARQQAKTVAAPENDALADAPDLRQSVQYLVQEQVNPLREQLAAAQARLQEVEPLAERARTTADSLAEEQKQRIVQSTLSVMDTEFPGWRGECTSTTFQTWLGAQPRPIQDLYEHGVTPDECRPVLALYSAQTGRLTKPQAAAPAQAPAAAPASAPAATAQDRLRASVGIAPRVARVVPPVDPDDFDAAWEEATKGK